VLAAWKGVVGKRCVWADEDIVFNSNAVPQLNAAFDGDPVTNDHIVFYEAVRADVASGADPSVWQHHGELPDAGVCADVRGLNVGNAMDRSSH
jgi:hypothetical protein